MGPPFGEGQAQGAAARIIPGSAVVDTLVTRPMLGQRTKDGGHMSGMQRSRIGGWVVCAGLVLSAQQPDQALFLKKARLAYYSLATERMDTFQATLVPNWRQVLEEGKVSPEALAPAVEKLKAIQFSLTLDRQGGAKITHTTPATENDQVAAAFKQIYDGMEQATTGFFQTWTVFMINPPLPEPGTPFRLETLGAWHILTYDEGATRIETTLGQDFAVSAMKIITKNFNSTINPSFARTPKGLVLVGYQATYRSPAAGDATDLTVAIDNQEVNGLTVPRKMDLRGTYGGTPFHMEVAFTGGRAAKY